MAKKIIVANPHGFCLGVTRAVNLAKDTAKKYPKQTYLLGEIVHNQFVVKDLKDNYGIFTVNSLQEIPAGSAVIIRAHGASPQSFSEAKSLGLNIIDATCPLVSKVHQDVKKIASENKHIIYVASDLDHDEAISVQSQAPKNITLITLKDLSNLEIKNPQDTIVITQTTLSIFETQKELEKIKQKYPQIIIQPHICDATTQRQKAISKIAKESDILIIVGSKNSSNSKRLFELGESLGVKSFIIESASDLQPSYFEGVNKIAISSGASTPENLLNEVIKKINSL
ncbi:MAG: 4-hydroxy-3-methylbut-2-enyl diphosphate reductase [Candidatus Shapirobacteria bacterium]